MTKVLVAIWITAFSLAAACILLMLAIDSDSEAVYSQGVASDGYSSILFIGSSLTRSALPADDPPQGILGDGRPSAIRSVNHISERLSNILLADAINAGAQTVFLEINAYAHDYVDLTEPAFLGPYVLTWRETGARLRSAVKRLLNLHRDTRFVRPDRDPSDRTLDAGQLQANAYYRLQTFDPSYPEELHALLSRAADAGSEVIFFSPPRPESAVNMMGKDAFADVQAHITRIAAVHGVPLWSSSDAWPDDHFLGIQAHANVLGRKRFQEELARWYEERR